MGACEYVCVEAILYYPISFLVLREAILYYLMSFLVLREALTDSGAD